MNPRRIGMFPSAIKSEAPYQAGVVRSPKGKKTQVAAKPLTCIRCGAIRSTLYKFGDGGKDRICGPCFEKHIDEAMMKLAGGMK